MFTVLTRLTTGYKFESPDGETVFESPGTGFVDDVTLGATANPSDNGTDRVTTNLVKNINTIAATWEKVLFTNGGKLKLSKCFWILVSWKWKNGMPIMKTVQESEADISLTQSESGDKVTITRNSTEEAPKVLGCHIAANG